MTDRVCACVALFDHNTTAHVDIHTHGSADSSARLLTQRQAVWCVFIIALRGIGSRRNAGTDKH